MVNSSKVLTVSYGTFSCTLEGFDDSFGTMKAIAEYFRDLASDDRYFGAEPPSPDADMLARIAQREVSRHVEARTDGDKIVLRTNLPKDDQTIETAEDSSNDLAHASEAFAADAEVQAIETNQKAKQLKKKKKAEKRARKRAKLAKAAALAAHTGLDISENAVQVEAATAADADALGETAIEPQIDETAEEIPLEGVALQASAADENVDEITNEPDSVADKLARIRAVVGQPSDVNAPIFSEDEHADDLLQGQPEDTDLEDLVSFEEDDALETSDEDTISGVMSQLAEQANDTAIKTADNVADVSSDENDQDADIIENTAAALENDVLEDDVQQPALNTETLTAVTLEDQSSESAIRARVMKVKRAQFDEALANGAIEEEDEPDEAEPVLDDAIESTLSVDEEDELARELAAVEAELAGQAQEPDFEQQAPEAFDSPAIEDLDVEAIEPESLSKAPENIAIEPEIELDRLMDQTSSELEEPDGKKRRSALGHLRAAVASARADKGTDAAAASDETLNYRGDLESAVKPRRPERRISASDGSPVVIRPPLKLVAEQRVNVASTQTDTDADETAARAKVRPRRITVQSVTRSKQNDPEPQDGTFLEFAEEMGATELPDLLEAAAAYVAFVEGESEFSRPQLMNKVRDIQEDDFSREDGLRSFGQLLRQGKIEKIGGGRFSVSDRIAFKPDTRAAG